jgi:ribosomal protein L40E
MDTQRCSFCDHENPADAKFCNACGSSLHLQLCKHCGAIDNAAATVCYKCGTSFSLSLAEAAKMRRDAAPAEGAAPAETPPQPPFGEYAFPPGADDAEDLTVPAAPPEPATPAAVRTQPGRGAGAVLALAMVLLVVAGVFVYRMFASRNEEASPADTSPQAARSSPQAVDATIGAVPTPRKPPPPAAPPVAVRPTALDESEPAAPPPRQLAPPASPPPRPKPADTPAPPASEYPCTPAVAALGLCN